MTRDRPWVKMAKGTPTRLVDEKTIIDVEENRISCRMNGKERKNKLMNEGRKRGRKERRNEGKKKESKEGRETRLLFRSMMMMTKMMMMMMIITPTG